jgi:hypothetical protein
MRGLAIFYVLLCLAICVTLVRVRLINMRRAQCELRRREALRVTASIETHRLRRCARDRGNR